MLSANLTSNYQMIIMLLPFAGQMWIRPIAKGLSSLQSGRWGSPCLGLKQLPKLSKPAAICIYSQVLGSVFCREFMAKEKKISERQQGRPKYRSDIVIGRTSLSWEVTEKNQGRELGERKYLWTKRVWINDQDTNRWLSDEKNHNFEKKGKGYHRNKQVVTKTGRR